MFPAPGAALTAMVAGRGVEARVEAEDCNCRPTPHQHYRLGARPLAGLLDLHAGAVLRIERLPDGRYAINRES
jgi:hypothetical protein